MYSIMCTYIHITFKEYNAYVQLCVGEMNYRNDTKKERGS